MRKNGTVYFLTQDHLGGTSLVTQAGDPPKLVSRVRYNPYGTIRTQEGTALPTDKLYTGQQRETTAIYNYGARFYNADIGRFLSADSIVPSASDPQLLNRYSYVANNPLKYSDPTGNVLMDDRGPDGRFSGTHYIQCLGLCADESIPSGWHCQVLSAADVGCYPGPGEPQCGCPLKVVGIIASFLPGTGELNDAATFLTGHDYLWNEDVGYLERLLAICGVGPASGKACRLGADEGAGTVSRVLRKSSARVGGETWEVMPYREAAKWSEGFRGEVQAHHILEERHLKNWQMGDRAASAPAVLLDKAEHTALTTQIQQKLPYRKSYTPDQVWSAYQEVYSEHPEALEAIRPYFR